MSVKKLKGKEILQDDKILTDIYYFFELHEKREIHLHCLYSSCCLAFIQRNGIGFDKMIALGLKYLERASRTFAGKYEPLYMCAPRKFKLLFSPF